MESSLDKDQFFPEPIWKKIKLYQEQVEHDKGGDGLACFIIGDFHKNGKGVSVSHQSAIEWYLKAVKHGHNYSCYRIGESFENGCGIAIDKLKALEWYYMHNKSSIDAERLIKQGFKVTNLKKEKTIDILIKETEDVLNLNKRGVPDETDYYRMKYEIQILVQKEEESEREKQRVCIKLKSLEDENNDMKEMMSALKDENTKMKQRIEMLKKQFQQLDAIDKNSLSQDNDINYDSTDSNYQNNEDMNYDTPSDDNVNNDLCYEDKAT